MGIQRTSKSNFVSQATWYVRSLMPPVHNSLIGIAILLAIGACAVPEQEWSPAPAEGPNVSETAVTVPVFTEPTVQESLITVTTTFVPAKTLAPTPAISQSGTSLVLTPMAQRNSPITWQVCRY